MKQRWCGFSVLASVLAALTLSGPGRAGEQVPFKGTSSGVTTVTDFSYPFVTFSVVGEGVATHLGRFTLTAQAVVDLSLPGAPAAGSWNLTAANGDMLFVTFVAIGIDPTHGHGDFTVVGGTGRFQGASGSYTQLIEFAPGLGIDPSTSYSDVLEGTLSSPGSDK